MRALVRPSSRRENLADLDVELAEGDLTDRASLARAMKGVTTVYHVAADYRLWTRDPQELYRANAGGTENVLAAAADAGVSKVVYTSSVAALGLTDDGTPGNEITPVFRERIIGHYKKSKYDAERVAAGWAAKGLPVVIVNPSTPIGERDIKPTPTGQMIVDFLNRRMPAYVDTGLNLIDVHDVAAGPSRGGREGKAGRALHPGPSQHEPEGDPRHARPLDFASGTERPPAPLDPALRRGLRDRLGAHLRQASALLARERADVDAPDVLRRLARRA